MRRARTPGGLFPFGVPVVSLQSRRPEVLTCPGTAVPCPNSRLHVSVRAHYVLFQSRWPAAFLRPTGSVPCPDSQGHVPPHVPCVLLQSRRPETRIRQTATVPAPGSLMHVSLWFPRRIAPISVSEILIPSAKLAPCHDSRRLVFLMLPCGGGCSNICGVRPLPRRETLRRLRTLGSVRTVGDLFCVAPTSVA